MIEGIAALFEADQVCGMKKNGLSICNNKTHVTHFEALDNSLFVPDITSFIQRSVSSLIGDLEDQNSQEKEEMMGSLRLENKAKEHALFYSCLLGYLLKLKASYHIVALCE